MGTAQIRNADKRIKVSLIRDGKLMILFERLYVFGDFINLGTDPELFSKQFLQRYGARPMVIERTELKHSMLQFMYGWMKFLDQWSKQYVCQAQFTFMPELYPGGLVEFTGKDLVMYIEEVTHTFDLSSGFTTSASLTGPSTKSKAGYNHGMVLTQGGMSKNNPAKNTAINTKPVVTLDDD